jgi:hypothetical protein
LPSLRAALLAHQAKFAGASNLDHLSEAA